MTTVETTIIVIAAVIVAFLGFLHWRKEKKNG